MNMRGDVQLNSEITYLSDDVYHTWKLTFLDEDGDVLGSGTILVFDAYNNTVSEIREAADSYQLNTYQSLSSVRIFKNKQKAEKYETGDIHVFEDSGFVPDDVPKDTDSLGGLENKEYVKETANVWGRVAVLFRSHYSQQRKTSRVRNIRNASNNRIINKNRRGFHHPKTIS